MVVTVYLAVGRGIPILQSFAPIHTYPGLYFSLALLAITSLLASIHFLSDLEPFGHQPIIFASFFALIYSWTTIAHELRKA